MILCTFLLCENQQIKKEFKKSEKNNKKERRKFNFNKLNNKCFLGNSYI